MTSLRRYVYEVLNPAIYHGFGKKAPFFEGWYFKMVSADENQRYAIIPGVFITENGASSTSDSVGQNHAFIQVLDGMTGHATYHTFPVEAFRASEEVFEVSVGDNHFSANSISLNLEDEQISLCGELRFHDGTPWPVTLSAPGVMGPYAWLPFMECYHGVVSFDHRLEGALQINGQRIDFGGGRGYLEKDWGQAFPSAYVWQQTNHFDTPGTCLTASIAMVPSVGRTFRGFTVGFYHYRRLYRFSTYTGAVTEQLRITDDHVFWNIRDRRYRLEMISERASGGLLLAPIRTEMHKRVDETLKAAVHVRLLTTDGTLVFEGTGRNAGLEVHGDLDTLLSAR
ncbi:MAG: tocopherol cyclase family protein [bacterium]|nr:tocopherol cyclase family protein [bacterium]